MKVVILAGGFGTRLAEFTEIMPKPMVSIGNKPILWHIMNSFAAYGHKDFVLALGYKSEVIKRFFLDYAKLSTDFTIDLSSGDISCFSKTDVDWRVTMVDTGSHSMTGGRLGRLKDLISDNKFFLTYGDGVSNVNLDTLLEHHNAKKNLVTVTAVRPQARFGELSINDDSIVTDFIEKPQTDMGWINGGFFVIEPGFLNFIKNDETVLEKEPLERAAKIGALGAFKHDGFWQCMDNVRDRDFLEELAKQDPLPWSRESLR